MSADDRPQEAIMITDGRYVKRKKQLQENESGEPGEVVAGVELMSV